MKSSAATATIATASTSVGGTDLSDARSGGAVRLSRSPASRPAMSTSSLLGVDLLHHDELAVLVFEDVEQAHCRIAVFGKFERPGHTDIVDLLTRAHCLQSLRQLIQRVLRCARRGDRADLVTNCARIGGFRRRRGEEAERGRIEAVRVQSEVLDAACLLPELVEDLVGLGSRRCAAARAPGSLDRFFRNVAR